MAKFCDIYRNITYSNIIVSGDGAKKSDFKSSIKSEMKSKNPFTQSKDQALEQTQQPKTGTDPVDISDRVRVRVKQFTKGDSIPPEDDRKTLKLSGLQKEKLEKTVKNQLKNTYRR